MFGGQLEATECEKQNFVLVKEETIEADAGSPAAETRRDEDS